MSNPFFLGKNYLITGAASGIGRQLALDLSDHGANLYLIDCNDVELIGTKELCRSDHVKTIHTDLCAEEQTNRLLISSLGGARLDGFVHCAGVSHLSPLKSLDTNSALKTYLINSYAALYLSKTCASFQVASKAGGSFVYISSIYSRVGSVGNVAYAMSKSALTGLVKTLAIELAPKKIRVNSVVPGFVKTNMLTTVASHFGDQYTSKIQDLHPLGLGTVNNVSQAILFLLNQDSQWITGSELVLDGGFTAQ